MRRYSITQMDLFDYTHNEDIGDLNRLISCLEQIDFSPVVDKLNECRANGRNDFPNEQMLRILVWQFLSKRLNVADIRRDLSSNPSLRDLLGLNEKRSWQAGFRTCIPSNDVFSNFITNLCRCSKELSSIFDALRERVISEIPSYGSEGAGDGKYLDSFAENAKSHAKSADYDRRGEHDATYSIKQTYHNNSKGEIVGKKETHYGFRKHSIVDVATELPIASILLPANKDEKAAMVDYVLPSIPESIFERMNYLSFDRGYDAEGFLDTVRTYNVKPIVDKRNMGNPGKLHRYKKTQIYFSEFAELFMFNPEIRTDIINNDTGYPMCYERMNFLTYDQSKGSTDINGLRRGGLIYTFHGKKYTIDINENPRFFNEVARDSAKFKRLYDHRTSVERYHSRLDICFGFETHTIRGFEKMNVYALMADIIMLALVLAHKKMGQKNYSSIFEFDLF